MILSVPALWPTGGASGSEAATVVASMPSGRELASVATDGDVVYIFGGYSGSYLDQILRFDPATNTVTTMDAKLPSARAHAVAVWADDAAYLFGGTTAGGGKTDQIVRYDPVNDVSEVMATRLPRALSAVAAAFDGTHAYLFGGHTVGAGSFQDAILRYDPAHDQIEELPARLPSPRDSSAIFWTGQHIFVLGGHDGGWLDEVVRFDPTTQSVSVMEARLPTGRGGGSVGAFDGRFGYTFGGESNGAFLNNAIMRYDPYTDDLERMEVDLPSGRTNLFAAAVDGVPYVVGGKGPSYLRDIVRYDPPEPPVPPEVLPPRDLQADAGPDLDQVTLSWHPPPDVITGTLTTYLVLRGEAPGEEQLLAEVPADRLSYLDTPPDPTRTWYYQVEAVVASGTTSKPSNQACTAAYPHHLAPSMQPPCDTPPGWSEQVVAERHVPLLVGGVGGEQLVEVRGRPDPLDPDRYLIDVTVAGVPVPRVGIYTAGVLTEPFHVTIPRPLDADAVDMKLVTRRDLSQDVCLVSVDDSCLAAAPVRPDTGWVLGRGAKSELILELEVLSEGEVTEVQHIRVPYLGQAVEPVRKALPRLV